MTKTEEEKEKANELNTLIESRESRGGVGANIRVGDWRKVKI